MKSLLKSALGLVLLFILSSCAGVQRYEYSRFIMDTYFEIIVYSDKPFGEVDRAADGAFGLIEALEKKFSVTDTNSAIYQLNRDKSVEADSEMLTVFSNTLAMSAWTSGAFDPTIYPLVALWGFFSDQFRVPTAQEIQSIMKSVDYMKITITGGKVILDGGVSVDFGGILKGYAVDQAVEHLTANGIVSGIVNAGGNLKVFGVKPDGSNWEIGIRHPRDKGGIYTVLSLKPGAEMSVATSGDYERFFMENGTRYHHIMSPFDGYPVHNGVVSVSIAHESAMLCDGLSTSLFVMGAEKGIEFADKNGIAAMIITEKDGMLIEHRSVKWMELTGTLTY
ncbi:MAG: hypothetical protein A2Y33_00640 [Spirochaetes bacterium GWF1_51_8]|nr:MAG: hypothetical protein A2Y33_00640 [Spirochaetes bacterium GWF1_51_8]